MRRVVLLAGGALLAGAGLFFGSGDKAPPAAIAGPAIERAKESAAFRQLADHPALQEQVKPAAIPALDLDLANVTLAGDHYEATLADGRRARLTLDPDLQAEAERLLAEARAPRGAIVAMAPDGRILALAGRRTEEPKGGKNGTTDWKLATQSWAPAASVFKLVTASALVKSGVDPDGKVCFHGGIRSVNQSNLEDSKRDSRCETLTFGVAHSNNAILGKLAYQHLEPTTLDSLAHDLVGPLGELALPQQKDLAFAQAAAGFQGVKLSVLGGAVLASTFADGGEQPAPRIIDSIAGQPAIAGAPHRVLPEDVAHAVGRMMVATCEKGSASKSFGRHRDVEVAGKTGTLATSQPFYMEHSWFVGYAPADKPQIIVSVLLGNPESWHLRGHEAAKKLIDRAIRRERDRGREASRTAAIRVR